MRNVSNPYPVTFRAWILAFSLLLLGIYFWAKFWPHRVGLRILGTFLWILIAIVALRFLGRKLPTGALDSYRNVRRRR
jgi:hypothetical protein